MNEDALRALLDERWAALEADETTGERRLRVSPLPVVAHHGPLAAAVDHDGYRHLLVPIDARSNVRGGLDGPVLRLRKRPLEDEETYQNYADLACLRNDLSDLFTELCVDVLDAAEELPENPTKALYRVLDRWKALFRSPGTLLGPDQLAGLFGELTVLKRLLEKDPSAHRLWRGPEGHCHDFAAGTVAVEVKSTTTGEGRRPRIHGLDQLEPPVGGTLGLAWLRLQRTNVSGFGMGIVELVEQTLQQCDDESSLLEMLAAAGYRVSDTERYQDARFLISEERWYQVGAGFPGLTSQALVDAGVPVSVLDVEYTIDLSGDIPAALDPARVTQMIDSLIQESV